jgi:hypothetical protein
MPGAIVESGGQSLAIGAIADGQFVKRSGTSLVGETATLHDAVTIADTDTIDMSLSGQQVSAAARVQMSVTSDSSGLKLSGDSASPGNTKLYGTNGSGTKGWYDQPLHDAVTVADTDTIDLSLTGQQVSAAARTQMSITSDASGLKLSGDSASPGNSQLYGTNGSGVKGWYAQPAGSGAWTTVKKTSDENRTNNSLAADAALTVALSAATRYVIRGKIYLLVQDAAADARFDLNYSGTWTTVYCVDKRNVAGVAAGTDNQTVRIASALPGSTDMTSTTTGIIVIEFEVNGLTNASGTFAVRFAQVTTSATATVGKAGGYLEYMTV